MKPYPFIPDVVDLAHQIIDMHNTILALECELDHYKKLHEMNMEELEKHSKHAIEMTGLMISAVLDPDSVINKGHAEIVKEGADTSSGDTEES